MSCCQILWLAPNSSYNTVGYCLVWRKKNYLRLIIKNIFDHHIDMNGQGVQCWMNHSCWQIAKQQQDILLILLKLPRNPSLLQNILLENLETGGQKWKQKSHDRDLPEEGDLGLRLISLAWFHLVTFQTESHNIKGWKFILVLNCCNYVTAGAQVLGMDLRMGLRTRALPSMSHKGIMAQVWLKC